MAKKLPQNEQPYEPVRAALVESVLRPMAPSRPEEPQSAPRLAVVPPRAPAEPAVAVSAPSTAPRSDRETYKAEAHPEGTSATGMERERSSQPARATERPARLLDAERLTREKRCLLTRVEETELEALVQRVAQELNTAVKFSHLLRAAMQVMRHAEDEIIKQARQMGPVARPANSDATKLAEFELLLASLLSTAFRHSPPLRR